VVWSRSHFLHVSFVGAGSIGVGSACDRSDVSLSATGMVDGLFQGSATNYMFSEIAFPPFGFVMTSVYLPRTSDLRISPTCRRRRTQRKADAIGYRIPDCTKIFSAVGLNCSIGPVGKEKNSAKGLLRLRTSFDVLTG
jgi:hypothetical protein